MHPLQNATTFQLGLVVDTLLAERHLLQLHASLASHMGGAGNAVQTWLDARRDEADAQINGLFRLALLRGGDEDHHAYVERMEQAAGDILVEHFAF